MNDKPELLKALKAYFKTDVLSGKGGFFIKGRGHITLARARQITGIKAAPRPRRPKTGGYGEYAILRKIVGRM